MKRYIPLVIILVLMALAYFMGWSQYPLKANRESLLNLVDKHPILAPFGFICVYIISTALSLPVGIYLSIIGGFLFPQPLATIYIVIGATIGATIIFLTAKTAFGRKDIGPFLDKMKKGFKEDAVSYMLFLRLTPIFPFWLVNLAPAFFEIPLWTFVWTTFIGIIPGAFVFSQAGTGLGAILDSNEIILNTQVKIALIALGLFALLPIILKRRKFI